MSYLRFDNRVAIVTGAGNGLGRAHALLLASRGARVVVNDLGGAHTGGGKSSVAADRVVAEIKAAGGEAVANYDSVEDGEGIVQTALDHFKRVDIVINNAGILRDTSFQKMTREDWDLVYSVHVLGSFRVTHAAWKHMRDAGYGRVIVTASAAGIYGNFGQANYSMAKLGLHGFAQTLALEGRKHGIRINTIAPIAGSRMTETVFPPNLVAALKPEHVSPLVVWLSHESCDESGSLFEVGGGYIGKLRWERTEGATFRLSRTLTPEGVRAKWATICDFGKSTHPANVSESMQPILDNLGTAQGKGGNELIDVDEALGYEFPPVTSSFDEADLSLYALGVGAAQDPLDAKELAYVYEMNGEGFTMVPTFPVAPAMRAIFDLTREGKQAPGLHYGFDRVLHGEQYTEVRAPWPRQGKLTHKIKIKDIFDKGKGALVVSAITTTDETGQELAYNEVTTFVRGAGGWGGDPGPPGELNAPPRRAPDAVVEEKTSPNQALLYRLSGDWNPLHADPTFAKTFGFDRPILHGLGTFGFAARHVVSRFCPHGNPRFFKSIKVRFAESVFPGETLVTEMWKESDTRVVFTTKVKERDKVVISNAAVELFAELPKAAENPASEAAAGASGTSPKAPRLTSDEVFASIKEYVACNPELVRTIGKVFLFKLTSPESAWTVDLKNVPGSVKAGAEPADTTLELTSEDFLAMSGGKADAMKLYLGGRLKITGDVMASQKLDFLRKIDPKQPADAATTKRAGATSTVTSSPGSVADSFAPAGTAPAIFDALRARLAKGKGLAQEVGAVIQFDVKKPDASWVVDLTTVGSVREGGDAKASTRLHIEDADLAALCTASDVHVTAQDLYQHGKLRIDGDIRIAQRLGFLKDLV
jgi:NAD(P)-dependent dehydrogenase (short-subunit alcohol dehydrogenase family)/acyl dehydratase/ubiquinone biosynthesis protein UbiJ